MHIKRFEAASMEQALAQVRAELGPDALILSTRSVRSGRGAFGLLSRRNVEVQAALERPAGPSTRRRDEERELDGVRPTSPLETAALDAGPADGGEAALLLRELRGELGSLRRREGFEEEVRTELRRLRAVLERGIWTDSDRGTDPAAVALAHAGLEHRHAASIVEEWRAQGEKGAAASLEDTLRRRLETRLAPPRVDRGSLPRILVGAAGVGKTTTLAKLAARNEEGERDVTLVSLDSFRVGAETQLRSYAELMEVPFVEARAARELPRIVSRYPRQAVLVDTAGRSVQAEDQLEPLRELRRALGRRASIELVLDATSRAEVQAAQLERFASIEPDRLIFTRIDECDSLVELTNLLLGTQGPPVCWLANGQRVPEDLLVAEPELFTRSLWGEAA